MIRKLIITLLLALIIPSFAFAASSQTQDHSVLGGVHRLEIEWTAPDGTYTSFVTRNINGMVFGVETDPGSTAPQDNYDITLTDQYGLDIMGGALDNRDTANTEFIQPYNTVQTSYIEMPVHGSLTLAISGNNVNGATGKVVIYYYEK